MKRLSGLFVLSAALGCGIGPHVNDFNDAVVAASAASCRCEGYLVLFQGYTSEEQCLAEWPPDEAEQGCVESLFKAQDVDYQDHLDCRTGALNRLASCLNGKTCTDTARLGCVTQYADEEEDCPDVPAELQQDLDECLR